MNDARRGLRHPLTHCGGALLIAPLRRTGSHENHAVATQRPSTPDRPDPGSEPASLASEGVAPATGRVRFSVARWVLAPRTTWQARRVAASFGPGMDADTAWRMARLARHPEERLYAMRHRGGGDPPPADSRTP